MSNNQPVMSSTRIFVRKLTRGVHTRQFLVRDTGPSGWEVVDEQDDQILRQVRYTDWHRVERAVAMFGLEVFALERQGWVEA